MSELLLHDVAAPVSKQAGEPKEVHEARLGGAGPVFDVAAYVDEFNASVVAAYRRGIADAELPSEPASPAASSRPAPPRRATSAAWRRGSPSSSLDACVGCMACVNACPDTAILGIVQPASVVDSAIEAFAARRT